MKQLNMIKLFICLSIFAFTSCSNSKNSSNEKKDLNKYGDIKEYILKTDYNDGHQSYVEIIVSNSDKRKLLEKFKFEETLSKLKGRVEPSFITESLNYLYYVKEDGDGPYGYVVYALEKTGNTLLIYEIYGN